MPEQGIEPPFNSGPFWLTVLGLVTFLAAIYRMGRDGN